MDDKLCVFHSSQGVEGVEVSKFCARSEIPPDTRSCDGCPSRLNWGNTGFAEQWEDPLIVLHRNREKTKVLRNLLAGGSAFLIGGGPSANDLSLELFSSRGIFSLAVNNSAGHPKIRPQAMVCSDPPKKFSHSIWLDPAIMKFVPTPKLGGRRARLRKKVNGIFSGLGKSTSDCPNTWGFQRHSWLYPDERFFLSDGACWGNHKSGVEQTGEPKTVCTMLLGLRILYYLGARKIYLIGVDFSMGPGRGYSFNQARDVGACASNNSQYYIVNHWLCKMQENGTFGKFGLEVYNCYRNSGLRAFPFVPFTEAVRDARGMVETIPDLAGWYDSETKK